MLYHNAALTFIELDGLNAVESTSKALFTNMEQFAKSNSIARVIYGISAILKLQPSEIPEVIRNEMNSIFETLLN